VQNYGIIPDFDLFLHGLRTAQGWSVHGGLTTRTGRRARRGVARRRCRARELTAGWGKGEELRGVLTEGFGGRFDGEAGPAAVKGERRW
jgi:hypothetical protein